MAVVSSRSRDKSEPLGSAAGPKSQSRQNAVISERWFEALAEEAPVVLWSARPDGETEYVSGRWRAMTGRDALRDWVSSIHPDDVEELFRAWSESVATGEPYENTHRILMRDGAWRRFVVRARPVRDDADRILRWVGSMTDVEDGSHDADVEEAKLARLIEERTSDLDTANRRVANEVEGRRSEQSQRRDNDALYTAYIDNTTDGVFMVQVAPDAPITVETVNRVMERALGLSRAAMRGRRLDELLAPDTARRLEAEIRACAAAREPVRYEETTEFEGDERVFEVALAPVSSVDGRSMRVVGSARDLTERRQSEQQLRQSQKMEAVGQLTGGVAHDFNNLLQVVKGNLEMLAAELQGQMTPDIERRLRDAMSGADRGAKLTRQLLAFSRRQPLTPKPTDVGQLVMSMADLFDRTLGETIEVEISRDAGGWTALVDPAQLENAVLNLAINGRDAMPDGGRLAIAVRHQTDGAEDERIEIAVTDHGVGMSKELLARVFEPFFSTKPEGRGTGLGLPQVQGFIEQSHGSIEIESEGGRGTTVRLFLPRSHVAASAESEREEGDDLPLGRGERILLLEDDEAVRRAVKDTVGALGYAVDAVGSTREAIALLERVPSYDLLLSDVVMPGAPTPPDFARLARERLPGLKVLFMSGYAENVIVHQGRVDADVHLIQKPYRREQLARRLRQLLGEAPPEPDRAPPGPLRVMLVEDEPLIAMSIADLLESYGHSVVEARSGAQAKAAVERDEAFDVLLTDLGLPDIDGAALAEWCRQRRPGVPIVFSTGRDDFAPPAALRQGGPVAVMTKPFDGETLRRSLDSVARAG